MTHKICTKCRKRLVLGWASPVTAGPNPNYNASQYWVCTECDYKEIKK